MTSIYYFVYLLAKCRRVGIFFQGFFIEQTFYSYSSVKCNIVTLVSEQNEDISNRNSRESRKTFTDFLRNVS